MDVLTDKTVVTRKSHVCAWCGEDIEPFQSARYRSYVFEGDFNSDYMHPECYYAMNRSDYFEDEGFDPWTYSRGLTVEESEEQPCQK